MLDMEKKWILASASPRRKELLAELLTDFTVQHAKGEEKAEKGLSPKQLVQVLATQKAEEIAAQHPDCYVLGADTVVALGSQVLGKPKDEEDAKRMLRALSGKTHEVYTGVCIAYTDQGGTEKKKVAAACTKVTFEVLSEDEITDYVNSGSPMDKAGAYGIQDGGLVQEIQGSYSNVVGLPTELLKDLIKEVLAEAGTR